MQELTLHIEQLAIDSAARVKDAKYQSFPIIADPIFPPSDTSPYRVNSLRKPLYTSKNPITPIETPINPNEAIHRFAGLNHDRRNQKTIMTDEIQRLTGATPNPKEDKTDFLARFTSLIKTNPTTDIVTMRRLASIILTEVLVLKSEPRPFPMM